MIKPVVYSNCIHCMLAILRAMFHLQIEYENPERMVGFTNSNWMIISHGKRGLIRLASPVGKLYPFGIDFFDILF